MCGCGLYVAPTSPDARTKGDHARFETNVHAVTCGCTWTERAGKAADLIIASRRSSVLSVCMHQSVARRPPIFPRVPSPRRTTSPERYVRFRCLGCCNLSPRKRIFSPHARRSSLTSRGCCRPSRPTPPSATSSGQPRLGPCSGRPRRRWWGPRPCLVCRTNCSKAPWASSWRRSHCGRCGSHGAR